MVPPPENPRIAVVGCGQWGRHLVRNFRDLGVLFLVCDPDPENRSRAAEMAPHVRLAEDYRQEVLAAGREAVVLATPAESHFEMGQAAILAGRDVFIEKPLAMSAAEGARLVELAEARGVILMVGHVLEYHPGICRLLEMVRRREIGTLRYIYSHRLSLGRIRREENVLWSFAPHDVAVILRLVGEMPTSVTTQGGSYVRSGVADVTVTHLSFPSGVQAHIHVSWLHPFKEQRLVVVGSRGMLVFNDITKVLELHEMPLGYEDHQGIPLRSSRTAIAFSQEEPLRIECRAFLEALRTRKPPLTDGTSGLRCLAVLDAAQKSFNAGGIPVPVELPAKRTLSPVPR